MDRPTVFPLQAKFNAHNNLSLYTRVHAAEWVDENQHYPVPTERRNWGIRWFRGLPEVTRRSEAVLRSSDFGMDVPWPSTLLSSPFWLALCLRCSCGISEEMS